jgi:hypothetical protein
MKATALSISVSIAMIAGSLAQRPGVAVVVVDAVSGSSSSTEHVCTYIECTCLQQHVAQHELHCLYTCWCCSIANVCYRVSSVLQQHNKQSKSIGLNCFELQARRL